MNRRIAVAAGEVVLFQLVWFAAVAGAGAGRVWIGPLAVAALLAFAAARLPVERRARVVGTAAALAVIGFVVDSFVQGAGLLRFAGAAGGPWAPPWIVAMWAQLAVALPALAPLARRVWLAAPLGAAGGPLAYAAGVDLGAAEVTAPPAHAYLALAAIWALAVPLLSRWASRSAASASRPAFSRPPTRSEFVG